MSEGATVALESSPGLGRQIRSAVLWRSGAQIVGQMIAWASTFVVIRILAPADYGLFAMTQVVLVLLNMLNGYGLASALIQHDTADARTVRQLFGMLILLNAGLAAAQVVAAPLAAAYFRQPEVTGLLRVQALLYLTTPVIALTTAVLSRRMDFRRQGTVTLVSAVVGAAAAFTGAVGGLGVWTLVIAPLALFGSRAVGMAWVAGGVPLPSFDFRGSGALARYGALMAAGQLFWFVQSQADVFFAGRAFSAHTLGIYTTALFLTQIFVSKFVPPLNEVAFSAYARMGDRPGALASAFLTGLGLILLAAMPFYLGLAAVAEPLVEVVLGHKWAETAPVVAVVALAMPFMTVQTLFAPAADARGRPDVSARNSATGAAILGAAFLAGTAWGIGGLAAAWVLAYPPYLIVCARRTLPVIGVAGRDVVRTAAPPVGASAVMAAAVLMVDAALPPLGAVVRLAILVAAGGAVYAGVLLVAARPTLVRAWRALRGA